MELQALARDLALGDGAVWLGPVAHEDIWALMNAADIFMITNDVTNRCNPLYEAICAGLPVVSVRDSSTADLLVHERNALLADKDDTAAMSEALGRLCGDASLAASLRAGQRDVAKTLWSWEERMAEEVTTLERLVARRRQTGSSRAPAVSAGRN